jgi:DNA-binding LytR/AlgR family response regulator
VNGASQVLSPLDMVAIEASGKGVMLHMIGGEAHFEYLVLRQLLDEFPGLFFRAGRNWIVRNNQVSGYTRERPGASPTTNPMRLHT